MTSHDGPETAVQVIHYDTGTNDAERRTLHPDEVERLAVAIEGPLLSGVNDFGHHVRHILRNALVRTDALMPGAEAAARDDRVRDAARAWALAVGCDAEREQLRFEMPHLGWALDQLAAGYGVTR